MKTFKDFLKEMSYTYALGNFKPIADLNASTSDAKLSKKDLDSVEKYADRLFNNWSVTLPEMRIKRIIRDMARGDLNAGDMDQLLMILQRQFKSILDGDQMRIRRLATSWDKNNSSQNSFAVTRLIQTMRRPINTDLYELFRTKTKKLFKSDK